MTSADKAFAGSIPALYDRHLGPMLFAPYAADLVRRLGAAERVLETAAGTGIATRALAGALPDAAITATDLNQPMLDLAAQRLESPRVTWRPANALELPFADDGFDAVVCQFGAMFFPDKPAAFAEARRVLRPGGRFLFSVWDRLAENEITEVVHDAVAALFPDDPPGFLARAPHGYHEVERIRADLRAAGFGRIEVETVALPARAPSAADPALGFCQGSPLRHEIEARAADRLGEVTERATEAVARRFGNGPVEGKQQAHVVVASA